MSSPPPERRDFFLQAMRQALGPLARVLDEKVQDLSRVLHPTAPAGESPPASPARGVPLRVLRPPGALSEEVFVSTCERCGKCVAACPAHAIELDPNGLLADGAPYIEARKQPCVICTTLACMPACPSGALQLKPATALGMGTAQVNFALCRRNTGEDCTLCVRACPLGDTAIAISTITGRVVVKLAGCVGCGLCENRCPTDPPAIVIHPPRQFDLAEPV
ncbi:MAG: 4Fe-4S dicluster domain-containing protein [Phycisphaerae bacterium]